MTLGSLERLPFKVCGVTNPEDARLCTAAGASAVGVILFAGSPRAVGLDQARAVARAVQSSEAAIVGVFVNEEPAVVATLAEQVPLDVVQLSGHETLDAVAALREELASREVGGAGASLPVFKAVRLETPGCVEEALRYEPHVHGLLVDASAGTAFGGTGTLARWDLARELVERATVPVVLAGGIEPGNAEEALQQVRPAALDVCSGTERAPGQKDAGRLRALSAAVRSACAGGAVTAADPFPQGRKRV